MTLNFKILYLIPLLLQACGGRPITPITDSDTAAITIIQNSFIPATIYASPGDVIFIYNNDNLPHQILSQSNIDQFDDTAVFDSQIIVEGAAAAITVPETQVVGSTLYFYDDVLQDLMQTPNGEIIIVDE